VTIQPSDGAITFQDNSKGAVQVVADLEGYYGAGEYGFQPLTPLRVLDTRNKTGTTAAGPVAAHSTVRLNLSGELPTGVGAAVLNLTVTQPAASGFIIAYPNGQSVPGTSDLNFTARQTIPNQVIVPLTNDVADFYNDSSGTVQLIADLEGYFSSGAPDWYVPDGPTRIVDTRFGYSSSGPAEPISAHGTIPIDSADYYTGIAGPACVPNCPPPVDYLFNVTVTQPQAPGSLTAYPSGQVHPATSNLNFLAGQTIANLVTVQAPGNIVRIYNDSSGLVQLVVDQEGYYIDEVAYTGPDWVAGHSGR
jgi:hypothetical protein